ncbi:MAG: manganese efflux pump MntP family protein [Acidobacteriota bacterium]|jgi:putative Mn2+ efflux pump MntP
MDWLNLLALAAALAMDAFAVAVVAGLTLKTLNKRRVFRLSFHFGLFQGLMPTLGWTAGIAVDRYISAFDHWIAFGLLAFIGGKMIHGAVRGGEERPGSSTDPTKGWSLVVLSFATSIDALAVGLSLALIGSKILIPVIVIGIVAAGFTILGMYLGRRIGFHWGHKVEILGGIILILIGIKIVVEQLVA